MFKNAEGKDVKNCVRHLPVLQTVTGGCRNEDWNWMKPRRALVQAAIHLLWPTAQCWFMSLKLQTPGAQGQVS